MNTFCIFVSSLFGTAHRTLSGFFFQIINSIQQLLFFFRLILDSYSRMFITWDIGRVFVIVMTDHFIPYLNFATRTLRQRVPDTFILQLPFQISVSVISDAVKQLILVELHRIRYQAWNDL